MQSIYTSFARFFISISSLSHRVLTPTPQVSDIAKPYQIYVKLPNKLKIVLHKG
jgi:hypothetical protein